MSAVASIDAARIREAQQRLYAPTAHELSQRLPEIGESLLAAAVELSKSPAPDRCETFAARLNGVARLSMQLRMAILRESQPPSSQAAQG